MQMRRGDLVTVAAAGDYGKPRPAVVVQTDAFPENHASVVVCQLTSDLADAADFRVTIEPNPENGLRLKSQCAFRRRRPRCPAHGDHVIRSMTTRTAHELDGAVGFIF
jgi:mRNA-degrading endonuclease toxin of MazEF toxin-antitoxin module